MTTTGNGIGINVPENMYTRSMAAEEVGRSVDTLKRWQHHGLAVPSEHMKAGKLTVWLYTAEDLRNLKDIAANQRPGRKPKPKE